MRLSVLDQSPVSSGSTAADALMETVALAQAAEALGYSRYWLAEHHGSPGLAGTTPEVLVARVAAATARMRVGAGGVLLSHYSPRKVADTFRVLSALFPGRIDLGIGRADGAAPSVAAALQEGAQDGGLPFGRKLADLLSLLDAAAQTEVPEVWLLASSSDGAAAAASLGLPLCFAHFISPGFVPQTLARYRQGFQPSSNRRGPEASVAAAVICADTDAEAARLATSAEVWRLSSEEERGPLPSVVEAAARRSSGLDLARIAQNRQRLVVGGPQRVTDTLTAMAASLDVDELVILTVCHDPRARLRSYELLAEAFDLSPGEPSTT